LQTVPNLASTKASRGSFQLTRDPISRGQS
jgi:hypothetical protein